MWHIYVHDVVTEQDLIETHLCAMMRSLIIVKASPIIIMS